MSLAKRRLTYSDGNFATHVLGEDLAPLDQLRAQTPDSRR